ncbi:MULTISPECIES: hypothetical protein [Legionella]|uniref:ADP-ribosyltransferase exoenzyme n=1 Tax=Legionella maceachernii TaxID=466 RepID=A0A0W0VZX7_9GAMM|nr:hypothetical protein [Legionella maceachernii]KTD25555.1 hypothetical protein Lmac_1919 [Legionella maceachernii]SJZ56051.1 hypothetical protein SAMN02745128_00406 [Legionella maceachernii]SUP00489.1 Uncharacterised protein [Legionella maceachernii]
MSSKDEEVIKAFVEQRGEELKQATKATTTVALEYGPLIKNDATIQFEKLIKAVLATQTNPSAPPVDFEVENDKLFATFDKQKYDVSELIKNANMNHLQFNDKDADSYMALLKSDKCQYPPALKGSSSIPTMADYEEQEKKGKHPEALKELNLAEKSAINIYTGGFYGVCNKVLRGNVSGLTGCSSQEIGEILATSAMGCAGLNKVSESEPHQTFRIEENFDPDFTQKRIDAVNSGGEITQEMGFFSTAFAPSDDKDTNEMYTELLNSGGGTGVLLSDLRGKYVASIARKPDEFEYLVPPTQMQWIGHYETANGSHFFHAKPVQTLTHLTEEQKKSTLLKNQQEPAEKDAPTISASVDFKKRLSEAKGPEEPNSSNTFGLK